MTNLDALRKFNSQSDRLDVFYHELLSNKEEFPHLWERERLCLHLSHGQDVERGFSVYMEVMVENL